MILYRIGTFSEINFLNVDVLKDTFEMQNGEYYNFSDNMCDFCRTSETVLELYNNKNINVFYFVKK